eukprot:Sdes_comp9464_c0_seq1m931
MVTIDSVVSNVLPQKSLLVPSLLVLAADSVCIQLDESPPHSVLSRKAPAELSNLNNFVSNLPQPYHLVCNAIFPEEVSHIILRRLTEHGSLSDKTLQVFCNPSSSRITKLILSGCREVTDEGVAKISSQPLNEIDLSDCGNVTLECLVFLLDCAPTLLRLSLSGISLYRQCEDAVPELSKLVNLEYLNLRATNHCVCYIDQICLLRNLAVLDLSENSRTDDETMRRLVYLNQSLVVLKLRNTLITDASYQYIDQLLGLVELDVSENVLIDVNFFSSLARLVHLKWLNLSKTKIDSRMLEYLEGHLTRLEFLSVCMTCVESVVKFPSSVVSGDLTVPQLLNTLRHFCGQSDYVFHSLKLLFSFFRRELPLSDDSEIDIILDVMEMHRSHVGIQIAGSASVYHLTKTSVQNQKPLSRRRAIVVISTCMGNHLANYQLQKNCCLTLCNFDMHLELENFSERLVLQLLRTSLSHYDDLIQRICVGLSNSLVCVGNEEKAKIGRNGGVSYLIQLIRAKIMSFQADIVMETAWSALWNITDETKSNCELFLNLNGVELILKSVESYTDHHALIRNMLGLLGNIAEFPDLRGALMLPGILDSLRCLVEDLSDGLEISYNASGIIANLVSDGTLWVDEYGQSKFLFDQEALLQTMISCIMRWDIRSVRSINYRSLVPIIRLVDPVFHNAVSLWAVWA